MSHVTWIHPIEDIIAVSEPMEIVRYFYVNTKHQHLFESGPVLDLLEDKLENEYTLKSFKDFYDIVMTLDKDEKERMMYAVQTHKNIYYLSHVHEERNPKNLVPIARKHGNVEVLNHLKNNF